MASYKVEGLRELHNALENHSRNLQRKALRQAVTAGAKVIVRAAKANAPVRTGALRRAIRSLRDKKLSIAGKVEVRGVSVFGSPGKTKGHDSPAFYWKFNELGTVKQAAKPFLGPALAGNITQATDAMKAKLRDILMKNPGQLK